MFCRSRCSAKPDPAQILGRSVFALATAQGAMSILGSDVRKRALAFISDRVRIGAQLPNAGMNAGITDVLRALFLITL
jgi:hypothetical protein